MSATPESDPTPDPLDGSMVKPSTRPGQRRLYRQSLRRKRPMKRSTMPQRRKPMNQGTSRLTARERAAYRLATERARTVEGFLQCDGCGRSLLDGEEQRHHIVFRSQGGKTESEDIAVLCHACHNLAHGIRSV